jgi:hypothetical protein
MFNNLTKRGNVRRNLFFSRRFGTCEEAKIQERIRKVDDQLFFSSSKKNFN